MTLEFQVPIDSDAKGMKEMCKSMTKEEIKAGKEALLSGWGGMEDLIISHSRGVMFTGLASYH